MRDIVFMAWLARCVSGFAREASRGSVGVGGRSAEPRLIYCRGAGSFGLVDGTMSLL